MCGIAGFVSLGRQSSNDVLRSRVASMTNTLTHRGPDDHGYWVDQGSGLALGHRRLAVVDLSVAGRQPMESPGGRFILTYNGEIYNFKEIGRRLQAEGHRFRGRSDTEVLLTAIEVWGLDRTLTRLNGMFAFALWDKDERTLFLARDRLGEKPLFYGWMGRTFLFGSEMKALRAHPDFSGEIDRSALALYFRHNCVPAPHSIYAGISKLAPGSLMAIRTRVTVPDQAVPKPYWSAREAAEAGMARPHLGSPNELVEELEHLLREAIGLRMQADVPLGAFLSGGIDSSVVVALMQDQSTRRVKTFTIGSNDPAYDEAGDAACVAEHLGTDHTEVSITPQEAMEVIPRLPALYDEPFADSSQIPTFLVSELARREVTVSLSGDGGDELFGGYNRYSWCQPIWHKIGWIPLPIRRTAAAALTSVSPDNWDSLFAYLRPALPRRLRVRNPGAKMHKLAGVSAASGLEDMYLNLVSHWTNPVALVPTASEAPSLITDRARWPDLSDPVSRMMYLDLVTYLPDDILTKVDRASMGVSLEARVPMLDHHLVEFAWRVPLSMKLRDGQGKWLLRQLLHRFVPEALVNRPKAGFGLPVGDWLRGPLRDWAEDLLGEGRIRQEGFLNAPPVRTAWQAHRAGDRNLQDQLWGILMFQSWLEATKRSGPIDRPRDPIHDEAILRKKNS